MKTVTLEAFLTDQQQQRAAAEVLQADGLICFPCRGSYRIAASLLSEEGVLELLQTKRRSRHRPALVLVADTTMLERLAEEIPPAARMMIDKLWPGDVTLRLPLARASLSPMVYKELARLDRKVGFRLAVSPAAQVLVTGSGLPLLVSSANLSQKQGATSVAVIRKHFSRTVELFIDAGDLPRQPHSTILDFEGDGSYTVVREGTVSEATVAEAWAAAG